MLKASLQRLWRDEAGFIVSSELVLIATIVVIGLIAGLTAIRDSVVGELADIGAAIGSVNQSFSFGAVVGHCASTAGSDFIDQTDFCETPANDLPALTALCIVICGPDTEEGAGVAVP